LRGFPATASIAEIAMSIRRTLLASLLLSPLLGRPAVAQRDTWALTNARIVPLSGPAIPRGTVVVRDGLIAAVGAGVAVPPDARVLDLAGKTIYPGLIDLASTVGLPRQRRTGGAAAAGGAPTAFATAAVRDTGGWQGLDPERMVRDELTDDTTAAGWRASGFTTVLVAPTTGAFRGQSALVNLGGGPVADRVVVTPAALHAGFEGVRGRYPTTLMGVMAYQRQSFLDAQRLAEHQRRYRAAPRGLERPEHDPDLEALVPYVSRNGLVIFDARSDRAMRRAVGLGREFNLDFTVSGAGEGWQALDVLRDVRRPILVSLNFAAPDSLTGRSFLHTRPEAPPPDSTLQWLIDHNPAALDSAGIAFALVSGGLSAADFPGALRRAVNAGLSREAALRALTLRPAEALGLADRLGSIETGKIANLIVASGELFGDSTNVEAVFVDGERFLVEEGGRSGRGGRGGRVAGRGRDSTAAPAAPAAAAAPAVRPSIPMGPPEIPRGRLVAVTNATIYTATGGTVERGTVLVRDGKIAAVGADVTVPRGAEVIDGTGRYVIPGIIDSHSHMAIEGGINEGSDNLTPQVRIEDEVRHDDMQIWNALAGGVTTAHLLHGSANSIGGQDAVIKLRWGLNPDQLLVENAPRGIKFALGENPKQSNRNAAPGADRRFPATRMGVEYSIAEAFQRARVYQREWRAYDSLRARARRGQEPLAPRRDLFLETLAGILDGRIKVHAHSYRADEIVMLLDLADSLGFKLATLQHVLEGYKVADEIAKHGAGASTFADMWGYKLEAFDAIPHNAALMTERGVRVSINSDDGERIRRLLQEAGKAVKWGGASEEDALRMVTVNAAADLGLESRIGSIEVGKDADFVILTAPPFDPRARVEKTIIDGIIYFDYDKAPRLDQKIQKKPALPVTSDAGMEVGR
jgi:imidazolonepropionase-like amidohydrolase